MRLDYVTVTLQYNKHVACSLKSAPKHNSTVKRNILINDILNNIPNTVVQNTKIICTFQKDKKGFFICHPPFVYALCLPYSAVSTLSSDFREVSLAV